MKPFDTRQIYYTYILQSSIDGKAFYVGKGHGNRMYAHERAVNNGHTPNGNGKLCNKIKKIFRNSGSIEHVIANDCMTELEAFALEAAYIDEYGLSNLCNLKHGGFTGHGLGKTGKRLDKGTVSKQQIENLKKTFARNNIALKCGYASHKAQVNANATMDDYIEYKKQREIDKAKQSLQQDLRLLDCVINDLRKALLNDKHKQRITFGIVELNDKTKTYTRKCKRCNNIVAHTTKPLCIQMAKADRPCVYCSGTVRYDNKRLLSLGITIQNNEYIRHCRDCNTELRTRNRNLAIQAARKNSRCLPCAQIISAKAGKEYYLNN